MPRGGCSTQTAGTDSYYEVMDSNPQSAISEADHRKCAASLFNYTWSLLEKSNRTSEDTDEMVRAAYASRWHWSVVGEQINFARGEWQISRCCAEAGRPEAALHHAQLYLEACIRHEFSAFDLAFAHEGMARALSANDNHEEAKTHAIEALNIGAHIESEKDRAWLEENLQSFL